jgi:uncharacterized repeat protein (TIGR01451 family)
VPSGNGFVIVFALASPLAGANFTLGPCTYTADCAPVDIFYSSVRGEADLSLTKAGPLGRVPTGRNMTYTLTVANNGPDGASEVTVVDQLPPAVSLVSAAPSQGGCDESVGTVRCGLGSMANGATATVDIVVRPTLAGTILNTAGSAALKWIPSR